MLANAIGEISATLGLQIDGANLMVGTRLQRFFVTVDDGVVTMLNIEVPSAFEVSSAGNMLLRQQGLLGSSNN